MNLPFIRNLLYIAIAGMIAYAFYRTVCNLDQRLQFIEYRLGDDYGHSINSKKP